MNFSRRFRLRKSTVYLLAVILLLFGWWKFISNRGTNPKPKNGNNDGETRSSSFGRHNRQKIEISDKLLEFLKRVDRTGGACTRIEPLAQSATYRVCHETGYSKLVPENLTMVSLESNDIRLEEDVVKLGANSRVYILTSNAEHEANWNEGVVRSNNNASRLILVRPSTLMTSLPLLSKHAWIRELEALLKSAVRHNYWHRDDDDNVNNGPRDGAVSRFVDVLKLSSLGPSPLQPWVLRSLMEYQYLEKVQQIIIVITIDRNDPETSRLWLRTLKDLQKIYGYKMFYAKPDGKCLKQNCRYVTSWIRNNRPDDNEDKENKRNEQQEREEEEGPDDAQIREIEKMIAKPNADCYERLNIPSIGHQNVRGSAGQSLGESNVQVQSFIKPVQWPVCMDRLKPPCIVYCVRIGGSVIFEETLARLGCDVFVFDPSFSKSNFTAGHESRIRGFSWGINVANGKTIPGIFGWKDASQWRYKMPLDIISELGHNDKTIDILHINLYGGEWNTINAFVTSGAIARVRQIVSSLHLWFGEEYFNLIDRHVRLKQLDSLGYRVFFSEPMIDTSVQPTSKMPELDADIEEEAEGHLPSVVAECCKVIGWIIKDG